MTFKDAALSTYNAVGSDLGWVDRTPEDDEFVDVINQFIEFYGGLSKYELAAWNALSSDERRRIILEVGP